MDEYSILSNKDNKEGICIFNVIFKFRSLFKIYICILFLTIRVSECG